MRTRLSLFTVATTLGAALPAFAQAPAPAPMYAPAPMMAPAPAPAPEAVVMPAAPVMAPRAADDMTGSVGFGVGVVGGTNELIKPDTTQLAMKYWMSDAMALVPRVLVSIAKNKGTDTAWSFAPSLLAEFTLLKGASTRFNAGAGVGLGLMKNNGALFTGGDTTATALELFVPVSLNVEHFFTRWFSMGFGAGFNLVDFQKQGDPWKFALEVSNISYVGSLFFYTD